MAKRVIQAISWAKARKILNKKTNLPNEEFLTIMDEISEFLKTENKDYLYHLKLEYGDKVIDKGSIYLDDVEVLGNEYQKSRLDFEKEVLYSDDPLGIVLSNYLEVFTVNDSKGEGSNGESYTIPLNMILEGDLFGVFGILDAITDVKLACTEREWYVRAGNVSFCIAFPFHNSFESALFNMETDYSHLSSFKEDSNETSPGDSKVKFISDLIKDWYADIAYIPIHYTQDLPQDLKGKLLPKLFEIGWKQSSYLRKSMFEDTTVSGIISSYTKRDIRHDKIFLGILFNYLFGLKSGDSLVMKPLSCDHVINDALNALKELEKSYFNSPRSNEPLPFIFGPLEDNEDWGLVSVYHIPILHKYHIKSLNSLLKDFARIKHKIKKEVKNHEKYLNNLPNIEGYGNTGNRPDSEVIVRKSDDLKERLTTIFDIDRSKINLTSKEFSNLLLIKLNEH